MNAKRVYVTRRIPGPALSMLAKECRITLNRKQSPPSRKELLKNIAGKDAVLCMLSDRIDREAMDAAGPRLKVISSYSTGFEHIDVGEATARGIYVTYTSDILAEATADLTFALILSAARCVAAGDRLVRAKGRWRTGWAPDLLLGYNVYGMTLGIIGLGRIGSAVARRAKGFGMKVLYHGRSRKEAIIEEELGAQYCPSLDDLLAQSDYVSVHVSMNDASYHLIDAKKLRLMKKTAFLINTSRGQVVCEKDLARALKERRIAGAGLDVFKTEPLPQSSPLLKLRGDGSNHLVLLPHIGSATYQTRAKMGEVAAKNALDVLSGRAPDPAFVVNPQKA